ncbi:reverse transcriptase domain-containing protein [Tanacetum coccineum]
MMITTTAFIRGEASVACKKKGHASWKAQSKRHASERRFDFRGHPREGRGSSRFTPLTRTPKEILAAEAGKFKPPPPMVTPVEKRSINKFCDFHNDKGHNTDECMQLKKQIEELVLAGKLSHSIKEIKQGRDQPKVGKKEVPAKDNSGTEGPLVIEAEISGHMIHRMYVDGGSSTEILYEHCFNQLRPEVKSQMVPATTSLTGFSGETIWPLGQFRLLVTIGDAEHSINACMNFMIVRSLSPYSVDGGIVTIRSTILIPAECATVTTSSKEILKEAELNIGSISGKDIRRSGRRKGARPQNVPKPSKRRIINPSQKLIGKWNPSAATPLSVSWTLTKATTKYRWQNWMKRKRLSTPAIEYIAIPKCHLASRTLAPHTSGWWTKLLTAKLIIEVQSLNGKLASLNMFLSKSAENSLPLFKTFKKCIKKSDFRWTPEAEQAFKQLKQHLAELPMLVAPKAKEELTGPKLNYTLMEKLVLSLVFAAKRLRRYFQAHPIAVIIDQPIKQILSRPDVAGRLQKWSVMLGENNITYRPRTFAKGHILLDFLVEKLDESPPDTSVVETPRVPWILFTDGSSGVDGSASNNEVEYEALIVGLRITAQMGVCNVHVSVDSKLVANQVLGTYVAKEENMIKYLEKVKSQVSSFAKFSISQVPRSQNKKADALSKIASTSFAHLSKQVLVKVLIEKSIQEKEVAIVVEEDGPTWMTPIMEYLKEGTLPDNRKKASKLCIKAIQYELLEGVLYKRSFLKSWLRRNRIGQVFDSRHRLFYEVDRGKIHGNDHRLSEVVILAEIGMPTYRIVAMDAAHNDTNLRLNLDLLEERRERAAIREAKAKLQMTKYYNARVRGVTFRLRDFIYRSNDVSHAVAGGKLGPKGKYQPKDNPKLEIAVLRFYNSSYPLLTLDAQARRVNLKLLCNFVEKTYWITLGTLFIRSRMKHHEVLKDFLTMIQRNLQAQFISVRTDRGTELLNKTLNAYFKEEGIKHHTSTPRTPEQNGVVERRNRTLVEVARTMLSAFKLPLSFWAEAGTTACYTQNRSIIISSHGKTAYHIINDRKPSIKHLHVFGCICYITRDGENLDKMKEKGDPLCRWWTILLSRRDNSVYNKRNTLNS